MQVFTFEYIYRMSGIQSLKVEDALVAYIFPKDAPKCMHV